MSHPDDKHKPEELKKPNYCGWILKNIGIPE
jgi:hypothetical protein